MGLSRWIWPDGEDYPRLWRVLGAFCIVSIVLTIVGFALGMFGGAVQVANNELNPVAIQQKYEWFKDTSSALDSKIATIGIYTQQMSDMEKSYNGTPRQNWSREDREQYNLWQQEIAGTKTSYNNLAGTYNSEMSKWNWKFANVGSMPECRLSDGAQCPALPREYKPYISS